MATYNKFRQFVEDLAHGVHNFSADSTGHSLVVALCAAANAPVNTNSVLGDLTEITYTNLSSRAITISASAQTAGVYKLTLADLVLTATGAVETFRYVVIYNDSPSSPADPLIAWYDHGSNVTLGTGETYTVDFSDANGLLDIT